MPRDFSGFDKGLIGPVREWHRPDLSATDQDYSDNPPVGFHVETSGVLRIRTPDSSAILQYVDAQLPVGAHIYPIQISSVVRNNTTAEIVVWW